MKFQKPVLITIFGLLGVVLLILASIIFFTKNSNEKNPQVTNFHNSMYYVGNHEFFINSVKSFEKVKPLGISPKIFIVNQHVLAHHVIADQFSQMADKNIETVFLITQNNWNAGKASVITSKYGWKTMFGDIYPDLDFVEKLVSENVAKAEEEIFDKEHGITGIVPYISNYFPGAKIVPIVIRDDISDDDLNKLIVFFQGVDLKRNVIVGSIDGSHYLPKTIADVHDRFTIQAIKQFDYENLKQLDIDTVPTLKTVLKIAEKSELKKFVVTNQINSADIVDDIETLETTSYISGYFEKGKFEEKNQSVHLLFVGDLMFDRGVSNHINNFGINSIFEKVERLFLGNHMVVGNLEGTITDNASVSVADNSLLKFTFNPKIAKFLKEKHFTDLSLANNHALDFKEEGFISTKNYLDQNNLDHFGSPLNNGQLSVIRKVQGKNICLVGYHDLYTKNPQSVLDEIQKIRHGCFYIIVFPHWGDEYESLPNERQKELAHKFIDSGADLIIGAHPHVVQTLEIHAGKTIFYSLGNFVFDQSFSLDTSRGLAVSLELDNEKQTFTLVPVNIEKAEVSISAKEDRENTLAKLNIINYLSSDIIVDNYLNNQFILWNQK